MNISEIRNQDNQIPSAIAQSKSEADKGRALMDEPRDPLLPEEGRRRPRSPDSGNGAERKRRRKVLSCYDCRRRKLQCDRTFPACGRCKKTGQAANCLYLDDAHENTGKGGETSHVSPGSPTHGSYHGSFTRPIQNGSAGGGGSGGGGSDLIGRLEWQDRRIKQLESEAAYKASNVAAVQRLAPPHMPPTPVSPAQVDSSIPAQDREAVLLRGKSFKTQYYGATHPGALIAHLPELSVFTREAFEAYPAFARIRGDMGALEDRVEYAGTKLEIVTDDDLRAMLPAKDEADPLVQLYLDNYESIYHVLHLPTFQEEYNKMWSDITNARPHFVALVLVIVAAVQCLTSTQPWLYKANSSIARERAISITHKCETWLSVKSQKHVTVPDFQIRCIAHLAKLVNARKYKRTWSEAGTLMRFCMSAGLHRNPDLLRKHTSALDKELRRRIWAVAVDFDLQASFDRGMVSSAWALQSDCPSPTNLHDESIDANLEHLPAARHRCEITSSTYLAMAGETVALRSNLNTILNNIRQALSFADIKYYTDEIESCLRSIPDWVGPSADIPRALLTLRLRQYLIALHDRQVRQSESTAERTFSRTVLLECASKMIQAHQSLTSRGIYALELLCQDQLRAALSICNLATACSPDPTRDADIFAAVVETTAYRLMDAAIDMLTDKVIRFGCEQRQLWISLAAYGFMKSRRDPANKKMHMQAAVEHITRPYYKILACQQDPPAGAAAAAAGVSGLRQSIAGDLDKTRESGMSEYLPPVARMGADVDHASAADAAAVLNDPMLLDLEEIASWTFEDWNIADFATGLGEHV